MKKDIQFLKTELEAVKEDIQLLKRRTLKLELAFENEIRESIQRIAEGHLDLSRILHDAMNPSNEVETLAVRVNLLEIDMKEVKARVF